MIRILLTGSNGQLGQLICKFQPTSIGSESVDFIAVNRKDADFSQADNCSNLIYRYKPDLLINAAAFTSVDLAEREPKLAYSINAIAPKKLAQSLLQEGGKMIHFSTDYVFNGLSNIPYTPLHSSDPINVYGSSKLAGENYVTNILGPSGRINIIRSSWLMGPTGDNFALKILDLHLKGKSFEVVTDQLGSPTSSIALSQLCWELINKDCSAHVLPGLMHWCDGGTASWYDIAVAIGDIAKDLGILKKPAKVIPINSSAYHALAKRPRFSVLDCEETISKLGIPQKHWYTNLSEAIRFKFNK